MMLLSFGLIIMFWRYPQAATLCQKWRIISNQLLYLKFAADTHLYTLMFVHQTVATHFNSSQIPIFLFEAFFDWQLLCAQLPDFSPPSGVQTVWRLRWGDKSVTFGAKAMGWSGMIWDGHLFNQRMRLGDWAFASMFEKELTLNCRDLAKEQQKWFSFFWGLYNLWMCSTSVWCEVTSNTIVLGLG